MQSTPRRGLLSFTCRDLTSVTGGKKRKSGPTDTTRVSPDSCQTRQGQAGHTARRCACLSRTRGDGGQARVFCEGQGDGLKGLGKGAHGVLLQRRDLAERREKKREMSGGRGEERNTAPASSGRTVSAFLETARLQAISGAPPPYTTRSSRTRLRTTQMASCRLRLASSII